MRETVLEKYAKKGWLKFGNKKFSGGDRLFAGHRFYTDYVKSHALSYGVVDLKKPRVDGGFWGWSDEMIDLKDSFLKAYESISKKYRPLISKVVLEDKELKFEKQNYVHDLEVAKENLCLALDELIYFYYGKK